MTSADLGYIGARRTLHLAMRDTSGSVRQAEPCERGRSRGASSTRDGDRGPPVGRQISACAYPLFGSLNATAGLMSRAALGRRMVPWLTWSTAAGSWHLDGDGPVNGAKVMHLPVTCRPRDGKSFPGGNAAGKPLPSKTIPGSSGSLHGVLAGVRVCLADDCAVHSRHADNPGLRRRARTLSWRG
jgi:hypothetical protein